MATRSILIIGNYPPPFGGVPSHIAELVPYLVHCGWEVHVMSGGDGPSERHEAYTVHRDCRTAFRRRVDACSLRIHCALRGQSDSLRFVTDGFPAEKARQHLNSLSLASRIVAQHRVRAISAYNLIVAGPVGAVLSRVNNLPLVVTNFGEIYSSPGFFEAHRALVDFMLEQAVALVSMTHHCAKSYQHLGVMRDVQIIPIGVNTDRFHPNVDRRTTRDRLGFSSADKVILFVGRMTEEMGLHTLLAAAPAVFADQRTRLLIVGPQWKAKLLPAVREFARLHAGRVCIKQDVLPEALPPYYAAADVVVAPTQGMRACGSLSSAEAMATGKPVVASHVGGIPEFIVDGETGFLVPPEDAQALAKAVLRLLVDDSLASQMGARGRVHAVAALNKDETNRQYEELLRRMCHKES